MDDDDDFGRLGSSSTSGNNSLIDQVKGIIYANHQMTMGNSIRDWNIHTIISHKFNRRS
jgi:hypothetical protein